MKAQQIEEKLRLLEESLLLAGELQALEHTLRTEHEKGQREKLLIQKEGLEERIKIILESIQEV